MNEDFDLRAYLLSIDDPEERARTLHECGWAGDPAIADIEAAIASPIGGDYQQLLAAQRRPAPPTPKRALQRFELRCAARPDLCGPKRSKEPEMGTGVAFACPNRPTEEVAITQDGGADRGSPVGTTAPSSEPKAPLEQNSPEPQSSHFKPPLKVPQDNFARAIAVNIEPAKANYWSIEAPSPAPQLDQLEANPFLAVQSMKARPAALNAIDVIKLYNAVAFAMCEHGVVLNAHIVIVWGLMGIRDHAHAARLLTAFNHEVAKWLRVGAEPSGTRKRMTKRAQFGGSDHMYIYVHENGREQGFHTHELAYIPPPKAALFREWAKTCLARLARRERIPDAAVYVVVDKSRNERSAVARCWDWFRYLTKSLHPSWMVCGDNSELIPMRAVFKQEPFIEKPPIHCAQIASGSRNIWTDAQLATGFRSRFGAKGELEKLYDGSELEARRLEIRQAEQRAEMEAMLETMPWRAE